MPEHKEEVSQIDDDAMYRLGKYPEAVELLEYFSNKIKAARKKLDDKHTDDMQDIGFYRGQIYVINNLHKLLTSNPKE